MTHKFIVPIYSATVYLCHGKDVRPDRAKLDKILGPDAHSTNCASTYYTGHGVYAMMLPDHDSTLSTIGHEVFHLTHRILEWTSSNFDPEHHEQGALLQGWLLEKILTLLNRRK